MKLTRIVFVTASICSRKMAASTTVSIACGKNEITRVMQRGGDIGPVTINFGRSNPNSARPDTLEIEFSINGNVEVRQFENIAGGGQ